MISRGDIMLKIKSGDIKVFSFGTSKIEYFSYSMSVLLVSEGEVFFDGEKMTCGEGLFLRAGKSVECVGSDACDSAFLQIELDGYDDELILRKLSLTASIAKISCVEDGKTVSALVSLFDGGYQGVNEDFDRAVAKMLLCSIRAEDAKHEEKKTGNEYVDRAVRYIDRNYASRIKVESLAEMIGVDRMYLRNLFTEYMGMSTMEYIMSVRMERAKELLTNTEIGVGDVASAVGYADVLCFSKAFKKRVGASPTEYRGDGKARKAYEEKRASRREQIPVFIL